MPSMSPAASAAADLETYFSQDGYGHANTLADLVLVDYSGVGDFAWLRPCEELEPEDALFTITELGRRDLRSAELCSAARTIEPLVGVAIGLVVGFVLLLAWRLLRRRHRRQ